MSVMTAPATATKLAADQARHGRTPARYHQGAGHPAGAPIGAAQAICPTEYLPDGTRTFATFVDGDLRTFGLVVERPGHSACDIAGLDLVALTAVAGDAPGAAACGKMLLIGGDGTAVFQTKPGFDPALVWCANGTAPIALLARDHKDVTLFGPNGARACLIQRVDGVSVAQRWTLVTPAVTEIAWQGLIALRSEGLNSYVVLPGPLPEGVTPDIARHALAGIGLDAKLVILTPLACDIPHIAFHNAHGRHGGAPGTGLAVLALLAQLSPRIEALVPRHLVSYDSKVGRAVTALPHIVLNGDGTVSIDMPVVDVMLSPATGRVRW